jgi:hypothetical protein
MVMMFFCAFLMMIIMEKVAVGVDVDDLVLVRQG